VRLTPQGLVVEVLKGQGSHRLGPLRDTNALPRVAADSAGFAAGESVEVVPLREFVET
jgi:molybdopterin molybdotransferase